MTLCLKGSFQGSDMILESNRLLGYLVAKQDFLVDWWGFATCHYYYLWKTSIHNTTKLLRIMCEPFMNLTHERISLWKMPNINPQSPKCACLHVRNRDGKLPRNWHQPMKHLLGKTFVVDAACCLELSVITCISPLKPHGRV